MTENAKTLTFLAAAALALGSAYFVESNTAVFDVQEQIGKVLNENIDVAAPRRLRIVKFDRQNARTRQFEVAEVDGVWSIPSKEDYPADATRQMAEAATCIIDRKILRVEGQAAESHEQFGVVDPLSSNLNSKSTGVGTRVIMTDADDNELVDMIVGRKVKDSDNQYYVRKSKQDVTYVVELDPSKLSTNFDDWIEDDLLKLSAFDLRKVFVNDYSADLGFVLTSQGPQARVSWDRRGELTFNYDDANSQWQIGALKKFDAASKEMQPDALAEDEELNQDALNKLRNGLDDLLIVDVARKPAGLSNDLKAGKDFLSNRAAFQDLVGKGFSPVPLKPGADPDILSSEGEVVCSQRDGVEYVLRFGQLQLQTEGAAASSDPDATAEGGDNSPTADVGDAADAAAKAADPADPAASDAAKSNEKPAVDVDAANLRRYLFVMARFNKEMIEAPTLKDLPELPKDAEQTDADAAKVDDKDADQPDAATADQPKSDEPKADEPNADAGKDDPTKDAAAKSGADADAPEADGKLAEIIAQRKEIEAENQRALDQYSETIKSGQKKVADLNRRFGDWYYVISNDVYKQIHLSRADVIKKKEKPAADGEKAAGADDATGLPQLPAAAAK